ncbi:globin-like [Saccoglossus kowalevskii]|uniref:Extracellular globin-E1-like n=1 Tax=Saccoglossus kowalevskii TaxID=10224 RepID=A0ABM0GMT3_SACKO|nr:PREDICTED: extracellular globin-E1-like [Saccoglossus kowalevskii]
MGCTSSAASDRPSKNDPLLDPPPPQELDPRIPLTARQKFSIQKSWKAIQRNMEGVGMDIFIRLFKAHPEYQDLFPEFKGMSEEKLRNSINFETHVGIFMNVIDECIDSLEDADHVINLLTKKGRKHANYGVKPEFISDIEEPFLASVKQLLEDRYSEKIEEIYKLTIKFILEHFINGLKESVG